MADPQPENAPHKPVRSPNDQLGLVKFHIVAAIVWLAIGMLGGTLMGYRLTSPEAAEFLGDSAELSFGRIRMFHTHSVIFGWLTNGFFAFAYYAIPRLVGRDLFLPKLAKIFAPLTQVALVLGGGAILFGHAQAVEHAEAPWWADVAFAVCFVATLVSCVGTILLSGVRNLYVSAWYLILGFIFTALNFVMANSIVAFVAPGAAGAALSGLWIHNAVGLWVTPMGVAIIYYLLPVTLKKPIASHKLSLLGFWTLAFFYPLGGSHHYFYSPVPWWLQMLAVPLTFTLIFVVYSVVYNFFATMRGQWSQLASNIPLRFLAFGLFNYIATCTQGPFQALLAVQQVVHFTDWVVAHAHLALFGVFSWWLYAFIYWIWPRITGRGYNRKLAEAHFWVTFLAFWVLYYIPDTIAGLMQGFFWLTTLPLQDSLEAAMPFWMTRAISGVFLMLSMVFLVWNMFFVKNGKVGLEVSNG